MKIRLVALVFICFCILTACHPGTILEIFNNTGDKIIVLSFDAKLASTQYALRDGQSVQIGIPSKLQVQTRNGTRNYYLEPVSTNFAKKLRLNIYMEKFQIEKDGKIYAVPPDSKGQVTNLPIQPFHYPLMPQ